MHSPDKMALLDFSMRWVNQFVYAPQSEDLHAMPSPCIIKTEKLIVFWRPFLMEPTKNLYIVEQVIGITLHQSAHIFYGTQYSGDMQTQFAETKLTLIQAWNEDDFSRLEQNLIAHLSQQKKLNRVPTIFIGSTDDDSEIISLNNVTGEIVKENLITGELSVIVSDLVTFLQGLK